MDSDKVNRWLTLGANIGVLVGIILLVVELDQNRDMIRAQTRNDISEQLSDRLLVAASNEQLASVMRRAQGGDQVTDDEFAQYWLYLIANLRDWENIHYQYRQGTFDEDEFNAEKAAWRFVIDKNAAFDGIWCRTRQNYSQAFVAELESLFDSDICATSESDQNGSSTQKNGWTTAQQEIIEQIESCQNEIDMEIWLTCYHPDFYGWYKDTATPFRKADKKALALTWDWAESEGDVPFVPFETFSVHIRDDMAIVLSVDSLPADYLKVGDPPRKERWTSVLIKHEGRWVFLSEHADRIPDE